ncbi:MAG: hypothetical protein LBJ97_04330 [Mycoplasmataceae bacterium]|nr:hypothetical protein [Mycoplasmataceae bacterium]
MDDTKTVKTNRKWKAKIIVISVVVIILVVGIVGMWFSSQAARFELNTSSIAYTYTAEYYNQGQHIVELKSQTNTEDTKAVDENDPNAEFQIQFSGKSYHNYQPPAPKWTIENIGQTTPFNDDEIKIKSSQITSNANDGNFQYAAWIYSNNIPAPQTYHIGVHVSIDNYVITDYIYVLLTVSND